MAGGKRALVILNPSAGSAVTSAELMDLCPPDLDLRVLEVDKARDRRDLARHILVEAREGRGDCDLVVAAGGDGTVSSVASALVGTDLALGVLPLGTSNSFAAGLGIPGDLRGALQTLSAGVPLTIDTAEANGSTVILHAALGLHADAVAETPKESKQRWGPLAYLATTWRKLSDLVPFELRITTPAGTVVSPACAVMVANVAPPKTVLAQGTGQVRSCDGLLDLTVMTATDRGQALVAGMELLVSAAFGDPVEGRNVACMRADAFRIETHPPQRILLDGEDAGTGQLDIRCRPASLRVIVPAA